MVFSLGCVLRRGVCGANGKAKEGGGVVHMRLQLMRAKYKGRCITCRKGIRPGAVIGYGGTWQTWCRECASLRVTTEGARAVRGAKHRWGGVEEIESKIPLTSEAGNAG